MVEHRYVAHGVVSVGDRVLLLRRRDGRYLGGQWDVPGGSVEPGETSGDAAVRECAEETGLVAELGPEVSRVENRDTEGRDLVFHTVTYELRLAASGAGSDTGTGAGTPPVALAEAEHDDHAWLTVPDALELPLVWHVRASLEALAER